MFLWLLCNFAFQIYIAAAKYRKMEDDFLRTVGNGGIEMVAIVKIKKNANTTVVKIQQ